MRWWWWWWWWLTIVAAPQIANSESRILALSLHNSVCPSIVTFSFSVRYSSFFLPSTTQIFSFSKYFPLFPSPLQENRFSFSKHFPPFPFLFFFSSAKSNLGTESRIRTVYFVYLVQISTKFHHCKCKLNWTKWSLRDPGDCWNFNKYWVNFKPQ